MPILALQLKANLVNVTDLRPEDYDDHRWYFKIKCSNCGETPEHWLYATTQETHELSKGHGTAHLLVKCQLCSRVNSMEILTDSYKAYSAEKNEEWQPIVKFDCRGLEPVDFDPRVGWRAIGVESGTVFEDIDLHDKEWADYDEKVNEPVEINNIGSREIKKMATITLKSKDNEFFTIPAKVMCQSILFDDMLKVAEPEAVIPIDNIEGKYLKIILDYLERHQDDPTYVPPEDYNCEISLEDKEFFEKIPSEDMVPLLNAGNFLNIQRFTDAGLLFIRGWLEGKNPEEIRYILQLPDDYTDA
uniref:SKP1 component POZ domain-containing protein n=1 Tax=Panagrolaimus sp. JU765 TaxID=591449 RepID=A0AC34RNK5_9BILA